MFCLCMRLVVPPTGSESRSFVYAPTITNNRCFNHLLFFVLFLADKLLELMGRNQKLLAKKISDLVVPVSSKHLDIPQVVDADGVIFYPTGSLSTVDELSLLVPMSPTFG